MHKNKDSTPGICYNAELVYHPMILGPTSNVIHIVRVELCSYYKQFRFVLNPNGKQYTTFHEEISPHAVVRLSESSHEYKLIEAIRGVILGKR